jgi:hypothetical protein
VTSRALAGLLAFALMLAPAPAPLGAQRPVPPPKRVPPPPGQPAGRPPRPGLPGDSARKDTLHAPALVAWEQTDSVMDALLSRPGYIATRYQGATVRFEAADRAIHLHGGDSARAAVGRQQTILVGKTIVYNDSTQKIDAEGDTVVLRDPSQNAADVVARGRMSYDLTTHTAAVTNIVTSVESGQRWYIEGKRAAVVSDTTKAREDRLYARDGSITSCDDTVPDYHFQFHEGKVVAKRVLVARLAVLYISDVPVMWLPFIFQDLRNGRRSGMITPRFGVSELFRNSPSYRRHVENLGYYFALSDFMDAQVSLDWRSGARPSPGDPGWVRYNGEWRYRWLDRFMTGRLGLSHLSQRDGQTNTSLSWGHQQDFSQRSHLNANLNYVTSTAVQRNTSYNPYAVLATIQSQLNFQQQLGPANFGIGGAQRQYPGRSQVDRDFPSVNLATRGPLSIGDWFTWTPTMAFANSQNINMDQGGGDFAWRYSTGAAGALDSVRVRRDSRRSTLNFNTPIKVFDFAWRNSFTLTDVENDFPQAFTIVNPADTSVRTSRVYAKNYRTDLDWQTGIDLPRLGQGRWNLVPSVAIVNVDPSAYWVRTHLTGGTWVHQSKRLQYAVTASPTFFGLFPGFGPVTRFRHSLTPSISWTYAPKATVSDEFLSALNRTRQGYLGALAQNQLSLRLTQNLEAKLRAPNDSNPEAAPKLKLLSLDFDALTYDFERARVAKSGITNTSFGYGARSDLLPGFDFHSRYSLFQGNPLSDTAVFKPYREEVSASFSLGRRSPLLAAMARLLGFGPRGAAAAPVTIPKEQPVDQGFRQQVATQQVGGVSSRGAIFNTPVSTGQGWQASFTFTSSRQRPVIGGTVVNIDPRQECAGLPQGSLSYLLCVQSKQTSPGLGSTFNSTTDGGPIYRSPATRNLQSSLSFNVTPKWAASWQTTYDFEAQQFASHVVSLQRELHDWRAIFAFTQAPNGNFAFHFFISLNANQQIKFDYDKQTYRPLESPIR